MSEPNYQLEVQLCVFSHAFAPLGFSQQQIVQYSVAKHEQREGSNQPCECNEMLSIISFHQSPHIIIKHPSFHENLMILCLASIHVI